VKWYLVRHGEIDSNLKKIYAGRNGEGLTAHGRRQARMMAEKLLPLGINEIYCSPMVRTVETAEIIGGILGIRPILAEAFEELALGPWEGMSEAEVARNFPDEWLVWNTRPRELVLAGRETLGELLQRVLAGLESIQAQNGHRSVLVVTHVAIIRVLLLYWQARDLDLYKQILIPHGQIFHFEGQVNPRKLPPTKRQD
jgi:broad specificity phosphatase PhoE